MKTTINIIKTIIYAITVIIPVAHAVSKNNIKANSVKAPFMEFYKLIGGVVDND